MDYGAMVKEAWRVTWRYKILWLFGLFAGGGLTSNWSSSSRGYSGSSSDYGTGGMQIPTELRDAGEQVAQWAQNNTGLIVALIVVAVIVGIVLLVLSIAARGGLYRLVNDAEEGREVRAGNGWSAGFGAWGRLFLVRLVLYLPLVLLVFIALFATVVPVALGNTGNDAALLPALLGTCGVLVVVGLIAFVFGVIITFIDEFAERHIVLNGSKTFEAISNGWRDFKEHFKEVLLMWLITLVIGIVVAILFFIMILIVGIGAVVAFFATGICGGALAGLFLLALVMVPGAIYSTFISSLWTIFWRSIYGRPLPFQPTSTVAPQPVTSSVIPSAPPAPSSTPPMPPAP